MENTKKSKSNSDNIWTTWKKGNLKRSRIVIAYRQHGRQARLIVKRFGKYGRKLWKDMENMEEK
jgi:hypothetical protein